MLLKQGLSVYLFGETINNMKLLGYLLFINSLLFLLFVGTGYCISGIGAPGPQGPAGPSIFEWQLGSGNNFFGNNTRYANGNQIANEKLSYNGTILHLSCANLTGGTCSTAPIVNVYVNHSGVLTYGTTLTCSTTIQPAGTVSDLTENLSFVAGDTVGLVISTIGSNCNNTIFDIDSLIQESQ